MTGNDATPLVPRVTAHFPGYLEHLREELSIQPTLVNMACGLTFESEKFIRGLAMKIGNQSESKS